MYDDSTDPTVQINPIYSVHLVAVDQVLLLADTRRHLLRGAIYRSVFRALIHQSLPFSRVVGRISEFASFSESKALARTLLARGYLEIQSDENLRLRSCSLGTPVASDVRSFVVAVRATRGVNVDRLIQHIKAVGGEISSTQADLTIFLTDNEFHNDVKRHHAQSDTPWLFVKPYGEVGYVSPIFSTGRRPCWHCLCLWRLENLWPVVDLVGVESIQEARYTRSDSIRRLDSIFAWFAQELCRHFNGESSLLGKCLISVDEETGELQKHHLAARADCPRCSRTPSESELSLQSIRARPQGFFTNSGCREQLGGALVATLSRCVSPLVGIIPRVHDKMSGEITVCYGLRNRFVTPNDRPRILRYPEVVVGKGNFYPDAIVSCLAEAEERYASRARPSHQIIFCKLDELPSEAFEPNDLLLFSRTQFSQAKEWNVRHSTLNHVCKPHRLDMPLHWIRLRSLVKSKEHFFPASYCYLNHSWLNEALFCPGDSNGLASGTSLEEAAGYGLFEVVERDAVALWWYNRVIRSGPAEHLLCAGSQRQLTALRRLGRRVWILDITSDLGVPTFAAISCDCSGRKILLGTAAYFDPTIAVFRAIQELSQVSTVLDSYIEGQTANRPIENDLFHWLATARLDDHSYLLPSEEYSDWPNPSPSRLRFGVAVAELSARLSTLGKEVYTLDLSRADSPLRVVKVIVPGLRPCWARFAPGRLYNMPVTAGWQRHVLAEEELNPTPYFL